MSGYVTVSLRLFNDLGIELDHQMLNLTVENMNVNGDYVYSLPMYFGGASASGQYTEYVEQGNYRADFVFSYIPK